MNVQRLIGALVSVAFRSPGRRAQATPETPARCREPAPARLPAVGSAVDVGGGGRWHAPVAPGSLRRVYEQQSLFFVGGCVSPRVDVGGEVMFVTARLEDSPPIEDGVQIEDAAPIRTTFILAIAQFRP